jgi:hypothetical protein
MADAHDTPVRELLSTVEVGVFWVLQLLPSQRSVHVASTERVLLPPTATQAVVEGHEIA